MTRILGLVLLLVGLSSAAGRAQSAPGFDHAKHRNLFPSCTTCHLGAAQSDAALWPAPAACAECHDGAIQPRVTWAPRAGPVGSNLRFDHARHRQAAAERAGRADRVPSSCANCHLEAGAGPMQVKRLVLTNCLSCHGITTEHVAAPDSSCAQCHRPLAESPDLAEARIGKFPVPPSHRQPGFVGRGPTGHGVLARSRSSSGIPVAASCATCHAREFCVSCHVDAPETPAIQALGSDRRSLLLSARLTRPRSHEAPDFGRKHGNELGSTAQTCATCHTRESCLACHQGVVPRSTESLATAGPGRGAGARIARKRPASHGPDFTDRHASLASAAPSSCAACHARAECLDCHRPLAAGKVAGFHPAGFLTRHPSSAYTRESNCSDCHNPQQFCQTCHAQSGLGTRAPLGTNQFHDAKRFFLAGHGQAARQSLETCVTCHVERDCLACHSATFGRRLSPHGPGFDPARLKRKNPEMCVACHGSRIP
jgi:hypothetical protein